MIDLSIRGACKVYPGDVLAVSNFSMDIKKGEFIVFVGPSGCGKSTMMRMIAGLENITEGDLFLKDKRINDVAPADRNIAMIFQNYALFGNMTVYENMGIPLTIRHEKGDEIHKKVMESAEIVEMLPELNRRPDQLSGGQRQRVAIGRSLVRSPEIFLMDEPLSNLDAKLRTQTRKELSILQRRLGTTTIYVTHDQIEAMTLADRIVVMCDGKVQQIGTPKEVYQNPANIFVGGFIGSPSMNFVEGEYTKGQFRNDCLHIDVPEERHETLAAYEGKKLTVGIRPEHFSWSYDGGMEACANIVECLGNEYVVYFTVNNSNFLARFNATEVSLKIGDSMHLRIDPIKTSFFDSETTLRIC